MNVRTALISSALLVAVLGWACEQQGPTSPSALGTPGGGSLGAAGGVSLDAPGGAILGVKPDCAVDDTHSSCKDEDSDGGKFVAEITNKSHTSSPAFTVFPDPTVTSKGKFLVDNKCNSGVELMNEVTVVDLRPGGTLPIKLIKLDHLKLRVNKCKSNFHVSVKGLGWRWPRPREQLCDRLSARRSHLPPGRRRHAPRARSEC